MSPDDEATGEVHGYMCLVDFECELGAARGGNTVYPSIEDCRRHRKCVASCGIVKVAIRALEIVQPENREWARSLEERQPNSTRQDVGSNPTGSANSANAP